MITKFVRKDSHFCHTICGCARVNTAIGIDSLGYQTYYQTLFVALGIRMTAEIEELYKRLDRRQGYWDAYKKDPENRRQWAKRRAEEIREMVKKVYRTNGLEKHTRLT